MPISRKLEHIIHMVDFGFDIESELARQRHEALEYLRKESLDTYNRLHSIHEDIQFINSVRQFYRDLGIPILRESVTCFSPSHAY